MIHFGHVENGVIVLDSGASLPEGLKVQVHVLPAGQTPEPDPLLTLTNLAVPTGVPDLASNIDDYLYGNSHCDDPPR